MSIVIAVRQEVGSRLTSHPNPSISIWKETNHWTNKDLVIQPSLGSSGLLTGTFRSRFLSSDVAPNLSQDVASVQAKISEVESKIAKVEKEIEAAEQEAMSAKTENDRDYWRDEKRQLRDKEKQLQTRLITLEEERKIIYQKGLNTPSQMPTAPGKFASCLFVPLFQFLLFYLLSLLCFSI